MSLISSVPAGRSIAEPSKCGIGEGLGSGGLGVMAFFAASGIFLAADGTRMGKPSGRRDADQCGRDTRAPLSRAGAGSYGRSQRVIRRVERVDGCDAEGRRG